MSEFNHIMIDLETLSIKMDAAILSIGAVAFNPETGELGPEFYERIAFNDAVANGNTDLDTIKWWIKQDSVAGAEAVSGEKAHAIVMNEFVTWLAQFPGMRVWGNGSIFDITILETAFERLNIATPWEFYNVRDCRTIEDAAFGICDRAEFERDGVHHNALDDAKYQAKYISGMWQKLRVSLPDELKEVANG